MMNFPAHCLIVPGTNQNFMIPLLGALGLLAMSACMPHFPIGRFGSRLHHHRRRRRCLKTCSDTKSARSEPLIFCYFFILCRLPIKFKCGDHQRQQQQQCQSVCTVVSAACNRYCRVALLLDKSVWALENDQTRQVCFLLEEVITMQERWFIYPKGRDSLLGL